MRIQQQRIRVIYAPLDVAASIELLTPNSPPRQIYNGETDEYEPDRELTPTVLLPLVMASAADGSWQESSANPNLADMRWFVDGADITTLPAWNGKYEITQNGAQRGALTIRKNLAPGEEATLHFTAVIADSRLGVNVPVQTKTITLSTEDKALDEYAVSLAADPVTLYNPFDDHLSLYEYKVAHGLETASDNKRAEALKKGVPYILEIPFFVFKGKKRMADGYTVHVDRVVPSTSGIGYVEVQSGADELTSVTADKITLDLRMVESSEYRLRIMAGNETVDFKQFSVSRVYPKFRVRFKNNTSIGTAEEFRHNEVMIDYGGRVVECPASVLKINWFTSTATKTDMPHNEGEATKFRLADTGIGDGYSDSWLETFVDAEFKTIYKFAADASGNLYTDSSGNPFIMT